MTEENEGRKKRRIPARQVLLIGGAFILGFIVLGVIAIQVWEYSNSVAFCANFCHDVHPEEIEAFEDSYHASIKCVECHMGRLGTLQSILLKASHFRHLPEVIFNNYDRPLESETMRPANESCELCHWPPSFHGDTVREKPEFLPDEENTAQRVFLILKTAGGARQRGLGVGIHWHIMNPVEYISSGENHHEIRWIRTTLPDGRTIEYNDVTQPLTPEEIAAAEKHTMDCVDCHNRVGHPFPSPEELTNAALAEGLLDPDLPYAKKEMVNLLTDAHGSQEEALAAVGEVRTRYEAEYPEAAQTMAGEIQEADELAQFFLKQLVFEEPGVSWRDFPDHSEHKEFAGCFRCHDGKHLSEDGLSIRLHCNICHSIPLTVAAGERPPEMPVGTLPEPASHLETNFMADHRFQADDSCAACHGELEFGSDDSSFCANSACHGRSWPEVELDAAFPHPIPLEGKHAEVWCHDCHEGVREPEYECANCHTPPMEPHFGPVCEDCHSPLGWEQADLGDFQHPVALEGAHAALACSDCHTTDVDLTYECANCHEPPSDTHFGPVCEDCHTPTSFQDATLPPELHPVPLTGAHQRATCDVCHAEGQRVPEYVCSNCHQPPPDHYGTTCEDCHTPTSFSDAAMPSGEHPIALEGAHATASCASCHGDFSEDLEYVCEDCHERPENHLLGACNFCHNPEGFAASASFLVDMAPEVSHELEGREDCFVCHDPDGEIQPAPSNHGDYIVEQCSLCHKAED